MVKKTPTIEAASDEDFSGDNFDFGSDPEDAPETIKKSDALRNFEDQSKSQKYSSFLLFNSQ